MSVIIAKSVMLHHQAMAETIDWTGVQPDRSPIGVRDADTFSARLCLSLT